MPSGDRPAAGWQPDSRLFDDLPIAVVAVDLAGAPVYLNAVAVAFFVIVVSTVVGALPQLSFDDIGSFVSP